MRVAAFGLYVLEFEPTRAPEPASFAVPPNNSEYNPTNSQAGAASSADWRKKLSKSARRTPSARSINPGPTVTLGCGSTTNDYGNIRTVHRRSLLGRLQVLRITIIWNWPTLHLEQTNQRRRNRKCGLDSCDCQQRPALTVVRKH